MRRQPRCLLVEREENLAASTAALEGDDAVREVASCPEKGKPGFHGRSIRFNNLDPEKA
ncbi:hypothetical protein [Mesorhizobium marinum]|uniref:hypothetical protein n=1 Tax=Mesorhizobium marinum TaxID=3228790 RepID=UPI003F5B6021